MDPAHDITLRDLQDDAGAVLRRAERGEHLRVVVDDRAVAAIGPVDEEDYWVDSSVMEQRIRGAQADPALSRELDELFPDTLADL